MRQPLIDIYSLSGIAVVHTFTFFPFVFLQCVSMLIMLGNSSLLEGAHTLGANSMLATLTVTMPLLKPAIARGSLLTFIASFGDFGAPMLLLPAGGDLAIVRIYRGILGIRPDWNEVSLMSAMMLLTIAVVAIILGTFMRNRDYRVRVEGVRNILITGRLGVTIWLMVCIVLLALPVMVFASLLLMSVTSSWGTEFVPNAFTLQHYVTALTTSSLPLLNTLILSVLTLGAGIPWALAVAYRAERGRLFARRVLYPLSILPYAIPGIIMGVAYIRTFNAPPLAIHATLTIVVIAYVFKKAAFCIQPTRASIQQFGQGLEEASSLLLAPRSFTFCRVTAPFLLPGIVVGAILIYISTIHDLSITIMLSAPEWTPLSLYIFREIEAGRIFMASAYSIILIVLVLIPAGAGYLVVRGSFEKPNIY